MEETLYNAKRSAMVAARELCYGPEVIEQIKAAKNKTEISKIMCNARKNAR